MERISFWISSDRKRGSKSFKSCTLCGARLFNSDRESLEFYGSHPSRVLCLSCKEAMDGSSTAWRLGTPLRSFATGVAGVDASRPTSMGVSVLAWVVVGSLLFASATIRSAQSRTEALPFQGVRDLVLVYVPYSPNDEQVDQRRLAPYVSYLDGTGHSEGWFFDSFLFLSIFSESKACFWGYSTAWDWQWWIDKLFAANQQIDALNAEVERVKGILGNPSKRGVIISVPYPDPSVDDFGLESKDGQTLSFSGQDGRSARDRLEACTWFVDEVVERWRSRVYGYNNLELIGFYWFQEELLHGDARLVNELAAHIRSHGLKLFWIPYNSESNIQAVEAYSEGDLDFDFIWIQPNCHSSREGIQERWNEQRDLGRVAELASSLGASIEIEMDRDLYQMGDLECLNYFYDYLDGGLTYLYMDRPLAYYAFPADIYASRNPVIKASYDALYTFVQGRHQPTSYFLHSDIGGNDTSSRISSIFLESSWDWGSAETVDGLSSRVALPGAGFVIDHLDPSKDLVIAVRYQSSLESAIEVRLGDGWSTLGGLVTDGRWHTGHWKVQLSGTGLRRLAVRVTNLTRVSDIWAYPDETIFRLRMQGSPEGAPGLYSGVAEVNGSWKLGQDDEVVFAETDPSVAWLVGISYKASGPVNLKIGRGDNAQVIPLDRSPDWANRAFLTEPVGGGSELSFEFSCEIELRDMWASPPRLPTDVGTTWDTSLERHSPGACIGRGWSVARSTFTDPAVAYRSGKAGSTILVSPPDSTKIMLLTLLYRCEQAVDLSKVGDDSESLGTLPPAAQWNTFSLAMPPSILPVALQLSGQVDVASMWVEIPPSAGSG